MNMPGEFHRSSSARDVLRTLLVEDTPGDARPIEKSLASHFTALEVHRIHSLDAVISQTTASSWDLILIDTSEPLRRGAEILRERNAYAPGTPLIVIGHSEDMSAAVAMLKEGASDYVTRDNIPALKSAIVDAVAKGSCPKPEGELLAKIVDNVSDLISVVDTAGKCIYKSPSYAAILGDPGSFRGSDMFANVHPEDRDRLKDVFHRTLESGVGERTEYRLLLTDGSVHYIESQGSVVRDRQGKVTQIVTIARDVTTRILSRQRLVQSEHRFRVLTENSSDGIALIDQSRSITYVAPSSFRILGYLPDELEGSNALWLVHKSHHQRIILILEGLALRPLRTVTVRFQMRHKSGAWKWFEGTFRNMIHEQDIAGIVVNYHDITEAVSAIDSLRKSDERYRTFVGQSSEGIWRFELESPVPTDLPEDEQIRLFYRYARLEECNDAMARMYGFTRAEELIGLRLENMLVPEDPNNIEYLLQFIRSGYRLIDAESHEPDSVGKPKYFLNNLVGSVHDGGLVRVWGTQRDVTDLKRSESKNVVLAHALRSINESVTLTDMNNVILFVNEAFQRIYGFTREEVIGKHIGMVRSQNNQRDSLAMLDEETRAGGWQGELWNVRKDGSEFPVNLSTSVVRTEDGAPIAFMGVATDITERQRAQQRQDSLYRIAQAAEDAITPDDLYQAVHEIIKNAMPARNFYIALYDEKEDLLQFPYFVDEIDTPSPPMKAGKGLTAYVLRTGRGLLCSNERFKELVDQGEAELVGIPSPIWLGVPLIVASKTIGVMVVQHYSDPKAYGPAEQTFLEFVSSQVANAIERKRAEVALREGEEKYRRMFEDDLTGDFLARPDGIVLAHNPAFARMFGYDDSTDHSAQQMSLFQHDAEVWRPLFHMIRTDGKLEYHEIELHRQDGRPLSVVANLVAVFDAMGRLDSVKGYLFDNTDRKRLEEQLLQAQKMDAVGQLASGIAHDFNNVMGVTLTAAQMIKNRTADQDIIHYAGMIEETTMRGASIAKQLLQFSRAESSKLVPISLSHVVNEVQKILQHSFPKTIDLQVGINLRQGLVLGDEGQIHQLLLNLCINARDAMTGEGGRSRGSLRITLESVAGEEIAERFGATISSEYAVLRVSDTGGGIPAEVQRRIFEPFFTTKPIGKGTGLGLSIVHGIVRSHNAFIDVDSRIGEGTVFSIYFPIVQAHLAEASQTTNNGTALGHGETVLVIEDEEMLRHLIGEVLKRAGYQVIEARDGEEGVAMFRERQDSIQLVLSDMGLPKLSGEQVFGELKKLNPVLSIIFSTGYIHEDKKQELLESGASDFIHKPYKVDEMLYTVRKVLDSVTAPSQN